MSATVGSQLTAMRSTRQVYGCRRTTWICGTTTLCSMVATPRPSMSTSSGGTPKCVAVAVNRRGASDMDSPKEPSGRSRAKFWFVFALFLLLMVLAHGGAELKVRLGTPVHTVLYYRVIFTIWACILLLTPALCFHVFSRADAPNSYWRAF